VGVIHNIHRGRKVQWAVCLSVQRVASVFGVLRLLSDEYFDFSRGVEGGVVVGNDVTQWSWVDFLAFLRVGDSAVFRVLRGRMRNFDVDFRGVVARTVRVRTLMLGRGVLRLPVILVSDLELDRRGEIVKRSVMFGTFLSQVLPGE